MLILNNFEISFNSFQVPRIVEPEKPPIPFYLDHLNLDKNLDHLNLDKSRDHLKLDKSLDNLNLDKREKHLSREEQLLRLDEHGPGFCSV